MQADAHAVADRHATLARLREQAGSFLARYHALHVRLEGAAAAELLMPPSASSLKRGRMRAGTREWRRGERAGLVPAVDVVLLEDVELAGPLQVL